MINKNMNLLLKLNKSLTNIQDSGPFTPLDQTLKTPIDPPNYFNQGFMPPGAPYLQSFHHNNHPQQQQAHPVYGNPHYNESDDILTDVDENEALKSSKNYSLNFTANFDHLVMTVYSHILSLPTTTPFSGSIPPSGLVSKVANETMVNLINDTHNKENPCYDQQQIINHEMLNNSSYQPIFLQLIRKRLLELCANKNDLNKLPLSTSITISHTSNGPIISNATSTGGHNPYGSGSTNPYNTNFKQSSISNLSLTDLNISNYQQQQQQQQHQQQHQQNRSRAPSVNLRKQSLTRNNSYSNGNNWLHVGNLNTIKHPNESTDSLQSMQDFVPQPFINRSDPNSTGGSGSSGSSGVGLTPTNQGFSQMMMDYQTPPASNKSSFSTPPSNNLQLSNQHVLVQGNHNNMPSAMDFDDFNFNNNSGSSRLNSKQINFPKPLTINTDNANLQALHSLTGNVDTLDSPFMSATTPSEDFQMMMHAPQTPTGITNANNGFLNNSIPESPNEEDRHLPFNKVSLSEKKRDSLKLKRGIH